jgi:cytoskeletal protein CcmA (bactofilin family)
MINLLENGMIDMKQFKDNVSNKIKSHHEQETPEIQARKANTKADQANVVAIGASIRIKGDVTGDEDLIIRGHVDGTVNLKGHNVTISKSAKVKANIEANQIIVEGELSGDMNGDEKVIIRETGNVYGNIVAPRVTLEDGALFKGSIEMEPGQAKAISNKDSNKITQDKEGADLKVAQ